MAQGVGRPLRIVLLGRPGSGKSSLLGALALAAESSGDGRSWLLDLDGRLAELKRRVGSHQPQPTITPEQVVSYPVLFDGFPGSKDRTEALLIDCDGNAAWHLLTAERFADPTDEHNHLAQEIIRADALLLPIPVGEPGNELLPAVEDFVALARFLRLVEEVRGNDVEPGGLPAFLILTKSDLLARPGDTVADWQQRLEQLQQDLDCRLQSFRAERNGSPLLFGQVDLLPTTATAIHGPNLPGNDSGPPKPIGVVELFRQSLERAGHFRRSQRRSTRGLLAAVLVLMLLLAGMVAFGVSRGGLRTPVERDALHEAVNFEVTRYQKLKDRGTFLESFAGFRNLGDTPVPWTTWNRQVQELLAEAALPEFPAEETLPGTDTLSYATVYNDKAVRQAKNEWLDTKARLLRRLQLVRAFGLVPAGPNAVALLKVPAPPEFTVARAPALVKQLDGQYPHWQEWTLDGLPGAVNRELRRAVESSRKSLLQAGRDAIVEQLQAVCTDGKETPALWKKVGEWLAAKPKELASWHQLIVYLGRLLDPLQPDPVAELVTFLSQAEFPIELHRMLLRVPDSLRLTPGKNLTVYQAGKGDDTATFAFKLWGTPWRVQSAKETRYTFVPEVGLSYRLTFRPGDAFWADLPVQVAGKQDRLFTWTVCRSQLYQFERLVRAAPRLHRPDQPATQGDLADGVELLVEVLPRMPELLPVVKLKPKVSS